MEVALISFDRDVLHWSQGSSMLFEQLKSCCLSQLPVLMLTQLVLEVHSKGPNGTSRMTVNLFLSFAPTTPPMTMLRKMNFSADFQRI